jgi:PRC-barrel domain protein
MQRGWHGILGQRRRYGDIMNRSRFAFTRAITPAIILTTVVLSLWIDRAAGQEIGLSPLQTTEVAKGYRAESLKLKPVVNEKNETIERINDFIFGKDGNIYVVLAVGDFTGLSGHLIAIPFRSLKLDDPSGNIVLPGASRAALEKLPVYITNR